MGLVEGWLLAEPGRITDVNNITDIEQTEATQPLSQTSVNKGELHVPIAMEKLIAYTVEKKVIGQTYVPF